MPLESERETPVLAHLHGPMSRQIAGARMPVPPGQMHVFGTHGRIEGAKLLSQAPRALRPDAGLRACPEEALESVMPEGA